MIQTDIHLLQSLGFGNDPKTVIKTTDRDRRVIPVLFIELQHHVVRGDAERPPTLVVLPAIDLIHVRRRHRAVVGVVVGVDRAAVVPRDVELDFYQKQNRRKIQI